LGVREVSNANRRYYMSKGSCSNVQAGDHDLQPAHQNLQLKAALRRYLWGGGILFPQDNTDATSGATVLKNLKSKHPDVMTPETSTLHPYSEVPDFNHIDVTEDIVESEDVVESVAYHLCGCTGPSGTDSIYCFSTMAVVIR
jgi:hypothetical protein